MHPSHKSVKSIGLFLGSFDPVHLGHLHVARACLSAVSLDEVWFVVSAHNPLKENSPHLSGQQRMSLVQAALTSESTLHACDIELSMPRPSYTYQTLAKLEGVYPTYRFYLVLGEDNFLTLPQWKEAQMLRERYTFIVYRRKVYSLENLPEANAAFFRKVKSIYLEGAFFHVSSSALRKELYVGRQKDSLKENFPPRVWALIRMNGWYTK